MKKKYFVIILLVIFTISLFGCKNKENATSKEGKYTIKFGLVSSENHTTYKAAVKFKEAVEKETQGNIKVELYPNSVLGGDSQLTQAVSLGTIQMAHPATTVLTQYDKKWGIFDMPFLFHSAKAAFNAVDGPVGEELGKTLNSVGIYNLGYGFNGIRNMTNNVRPINKPDDLKGIKMRVMESPVFIDMFTYLGANATPMSFSELFTGLQQKTVDGEENPASLIYESKFNEVQKYLSETQHVYNFLAYIINKQFFDTLPKDYQEIIKKASQDWLIDWQRETELNENDGYIKKLKDSGMIVNTITPENMEKFKEKVQPMYEKYKKEYGEDIFNQLEKYNKGE